MIDQILNRFEFSTVLITGIYSTSNQKVLIWFIYRIKYFTFEFKHSDTMIVFVQNMSVLINSQQHT